MKRALLGLLGFFAAAAVFLMLPALRNPHVHYYPARNRVPDKLRWMFR